MERIFIRIIFLVFPFIFFGLVNSSIHSDLGKNNQAGKTEVNNGNINIDNVVNEKQLPHNVDGDNPNNFKLTNLRTSNQEKLNNLLQKITEYKGYLHEKKNVLKDIKDTVDGIHILLGDSFSKLVYNIRGQVDLIDWKYEFYINKFYKLFRTKWDYIRIMAQTNSSIYSDLLNRNKELSELIVDARLIKNNAREQYDEVIKCMREVIDLINYNKSKFNSIRDYLKFISNQTIPTKNFSEVKLRPKSSAQLESSAQLSLHGAQKVEGEANNKNETFSFREMLLFGVNIFTILGITIYFVLKKKK